MKMQINTQDVKMGGLSFNLDNFLGGEPIGQRMFLVFVRTAALNGSFQHSPLNWTRDFQGPGDEVCSVNDVVVLLDVRVFHTYYP